MPRLLSITALNTSPPHLPHLHTLLLQGNGSIGIRCRRNGETDIGISIISIRTSHMNNLAEGNRQFACISVTSHVTVSYSPMILCVNAIDDSGVMI